MLRKRLIILALATGLPAAAMAMPENCPMSGHGKHGGMFQQDMNLDAKQKREMQQLMREQRGKQREIVQRYLDKLPPAERQKMQQERQASRDQTHAAMRKLLNPEQQKQFDTMLEAREARQHGKAERDAKQ